MNCSTQGYTPDYFTSNSTANRLVVNTSTLDFSTPLPARTQSIFVLNSVMKWVFVSVGVIGIVSNLLVILVVASSRKLRQQPRNWLILHLSIADCCGAVFIICNLFKNASIRLNNVSYLIKQRVNFMCQVQDSVWTFISRLSSNIACHMYFKQI